jgi:hypothetical protein
MPPWKHARGRQKPEVEHRPAVNIAGEKMGCSGTLGLLKSSSDFPGSFLYACRGGKGDRRALESVFSLAQTEGIVFFHRIKDFEIDF